MRIVSIALAGVFIAAHTFFYSCSDEHDHHRHREDVYVSVTGAAGVGFDAYFEDERRSQSISGTIPFDADFLDQEGYFSAQVDKDSAGSEQMCVEIVSSVSSRQSCTSAPFGRVTLTLAF